MAWVGGGWGGGWLLLLIRQTQNTIPRYSQLYHRSLLSILPLPTLSTLWLRHAFHPVTAAVQVQEIQALCLETTAAPLNALYKHTHFPPCDCLFD